MGAQAWQVGVVESRRLVRRHLLYVGLRNFLLSCATSVIVLGL